MSSDRDGRPGRPDTAALDAVPWRVRTLVCALALGLVSAPGAVDSPLGGAPLDLWGYGAAAIVAACAAVLGFFPPRAWPARALGGALVVLLAVKLVAGTMSTPLGWTASYAFGDTTGRWHHARFFRGIRSVEHRWEPQAALSPARTDLHFLNDVDLFGYPPYSATPREEEFPLDVTWTGFVPPRTPPLTWSVVADGEVSVTTDLGTVSLSNPDPHVETLTMPPGGGRIVVRYRKPPRVVPHLGFIVRDAATRTPVPVTATAGDAFATSARLTNVAVVAGLVLLVASVTAALARHGTSTPRERWTVTTAALTTTLALVGWATVLALRWHGGTAFLSAGGDPLYYGSSARDILHHGVLMLHGAALGQAAPYYFYPLYPYLLAGAHALFGDTISAVYFANGLLQACLPALFLALGWQRLRPWAGIAAFGALYGFLWLYQRIVFESVQPSFTDIAYMTAVFTALVALARALDVPSPRRLVLAGVMLAVGAATRPSLMTLVYLAPVAVALRIRPFSPAPWVARCGWLACGVALGLLPFTLRNLAAAGTFVVLVNSWIQIPYFLVPPEVAEKPGGIPGLAEALAMAWDIVREHPVRTVTVEARKVLYALGLTSVGPREMQQALGLSILPPLFVWALIRRRMPRPTALAVSTFAVSHLLAMFIAAPWTFHYKSILPLHAALLFGAACLLPGTSEARLPAGEPPGAGATGPSA